MLCRVEEKFMKKNSCLAGQRAGWTCFARSPQDSRLVDLVSNIELQMVPNHTQVQSVTSHRS